MRIRWLDDAIPDLIEIRKSITADKLLIKQSVEPLIEHPDIGRPGRIEGTRDLILTALPYVIPYRVKNDKIEILRVLHAARKWPHELE